VHVLRAVREEQEDPTRRNVLQDVLERILGVLIHPVKIFHGQDQGPHLGTPKNDAVESSEGTLFSGLRAQREVDPAVLDREQVEQVGFCRWVVGAEDFKVLPGFEWVVRLRFGTRAA
jgi:hypothetical protein